MRALNYPAQGEIALDERDVPQPGPGETLIEVAAAGICHTDIDVLHARYGPGAFPVVPGHEFTGTVEMVGPATEAALSTGASAVVPGLRVAIDPNLPCGECRSCRRGLGNLCETLGAYGVTVDGGLADYAIIAAEQLRPIGDLPFQVAALAEPLACVLNGLGQAGTDRVERALVMGAGPIGMLMALTLRARGATMVAVSDLDESRLAFAESFGITVFRAGSDALAAQRHGFDLVVEATGVASVAENALELVADGGTMLVFGVANPQATIAVAPFQIFRRQLRIVGSHSLNKNIDAAIDVLRLSPDAFARLVSDQVPLQDIPDFLNGTAKGKMKVQFAAR